MTKKVTSAVANKMLKQLADDKSYWQSLETERTSYTVATGEEAVVPEYDYNEVAAKIAEIDNQTLILKHAINVYNTTTVLQLEDGTSMTIDQALVAMSQLNSRKRRLDSMRKAQDKERVESYARGSKNIVEYRYINFKVEDAARDFQAISDRIIDLQIKLDKANQTIEFEIDL